MKKFFNKVKAFFKGVGEAIDKKTKTDGYTAFFTFMFYVSLVFAALAFLIGVFEVYKFTGAVLMVFGSYFSVRIIYHFIKDFVGLIKFYMQHKEKDSGQ